METHKFRKILVANRGEIALRIFRACYDLNLRTVAIYSQEDTYSLYRTRADEAYLIGENKSPLAAYLDIPAIIDLAKRRQVDAIHPGYGFLSENAEFARACRQAGIMFIGPSPEILDQMGDKLAAKTIAHACGVPTIPGSSRPLRDVEDAAALAEEFGYPVLLKAAGGGGGRGMRRCDSAEELRINFPLVKSEAAKAFGNDDIFIEKYLVEPKHIEVQILGDRYGNIVHLYERDCSLQRRYQKVIEFAPAWSVPHEVRRCLYEDAVKIARHVGYVSAGTIEFLVDKTGNYYFIEMNPRIQVEHTVTEELTGVDLVRSQILIAEGYPLFDEAIGIRKQSDVQARGYAMQCRITTEDPKNNFLPDIGKITSYRSSGGTGVRLDGSGVYAGTVISPYYDSLLVKITCRDQTFSGLCQKALRAISEEHIRGVKTNIPFITNILQHPVFRAGQCHTRFIDETPELFDFEEGKDRATKVLRYIAEIQVANPSAERAQYDAPRFPPYESTPPRCEGLKQLLDRAGPEAVRDYVLTQKRLLITDTTMRDAHQSLLATRMRTRDMLGAASGTAEILNDCFSLEMWGGATFDTAYRFLHESPWERLELLRERIPNIPFQMLLRGSSLVGYANYPDNLVRAFVKEAAQSGIDVFRVFDSLNWLPGMEVAMDEVLKQGKLCEAAICYTGDILDPKRDKYTLNYYVNLAKEIEKRGAHILCIKDMSGLLKPYAAKKLVTALKNEVGLPIHLHTHDTSGNQVAALLLAAEAGVDIVDTAIDSLSSMTSQPSMNAVVAALHGQERDTGLDSEKLQYLSDYWADVRLRYASFDGGLKAPSTDIYRYEMPGGQYTNLQSQVEALGLGSQFEDVREMYKRVNLMLGDIVKVTPSSKMVGDLAIFMVQNRLTPENILEKGEALTFPDSVVSYFKGMMGQPEGGFPPELQKLVLKGEEPITCRPGALLPPVDFDEARRSVERFQPHANNRTVLSWCLYPKVVEEFCRHRKEYGYITRMGSHVFFNGMALGETNQITIEDGKTLVVKYLGLGDRNEDGTRSVLFELNGMRREVAVHDPQAHTVADLVQLADPQDKGQVGAPMPGMVSRVLVHEGDTVEQNQVLLIIEAMKMETSVVARIAGRVDKLLAKENGAVKAGELLAVIK
ncbi:pyruvate carboxylase [Agathobaculum sp. Marseille-P7918]|uniref:pyruvate carboxylase n=1 Tax=Agathobaculum sp. Marseille-P7918 TaxID=2479843 RepID=UPI000F62C2F3|nr:pyruvate carboxylase [Agathobaculum sp. Marseille-P7918]